MTPDRLNPIRVGAALSITVALGYALCALAWAIWTEPALNFLNALFHGLDFRRIAVASNGSGWWLFLYPLLVMTTWAFVIGALFSTISNFLHVGARKRDDV